MANVMNQKDVKNHVHRSGFDLSRRNLFTSKPGEIVPVGVFEVIPGDKFTVNMSDFLRTAPFVTASFARLRHYVDAYFVPYRLLWDKFPDWIVQTNNQHYAQSPTEGAAPFTSQPYVTAKDIQDYMNILYNYNKDSNNSYRNDDGGLPRYQTSTKLLQYLGYAVKYATSNTTDPTKYEPNAFFAQANPPLNVFPLAAYQKIYQDYFRFAQWEKAAPWTYNFDYVLKENQLHVDINSNNYAQHSTMFDMRYCNLDKDLLNGMIPTPQFGEEAIASPISGQLHGTLSLGLPYTGGNTSDVPVIMGRDTTNGDSENRLRQGSNVSGDVTRNAATLGLDSNNSDYVAGVSVLGIRFAEALQKWKEITVSGSPEYKEQLEKHWNVHISDYASDRCRYLGGMSNTIDISEVVNQNITGGNEADLAGKGALSQNGRFSFQSDEYGVIMIVSHTKPLIEWDSSTFLHPYLLRHTVDDYAQPEFDNLGMQAVYNSLIPNDFIFDGSKDNRVVPLGYAPRYWDYKTNLDIVTGGFLNLPQWTLLHKPPTLRFGNDSSGKVTPDFFRVSPRVCDNLFDRQADGTYDTDVFFHSLFLDVKVARNLSYDGLPY